MINELYSFSDEWGLLVNIKKTAILVFNITGRRLLDSQHFTYGDSMIPSVREYCYLGTTFTISGSAKMNQNQLRIKGLRAYFSLKRTIDITSISKDAIFKLFDSLISPVASYGCQVWLPTTNLIDCLVNDEKKSAREIISAISNDPMEKLHLSLLKWTLGVKGKTTNLPIWGDTGRYPMGIHMTKLLVDFYNRLVVLNDNNSTSIARHAFVEQVSLNLQWNKAITQLCKKFDPNASKHCRSNANALKPNSLLIKNRIEGWFKSQWNRARPAYSKLSFYNLVKENFGPEPFLQLRNHKRAKCIAWLRTSSHKLNVETGRYGDKINNPYYRTCEFCCTRDKSVIELLAQLPTAELVIENEIHFLRECPRYEDLRREQSPRMKKVLSDNIEALFDPDHLSESSKYIHKLFRRRFGRPNNSLNELV